MIGLEYIALSCQTIQSQLAGLEPALIGRLREQLGKVLLLMYQWNISKQLVYQLHNENNQSMHKVQANTLPPCTSALSQTKDQPLSFAMQVIPFLVLAGQCASLLTCTVFRHSAFCACLSAKIL